jgi:hypothetical protein
MFAYFKAPVPTEINSSALSVPNYPLPYHISKILKINFLAVFFSICFVFKEVETDQFYKFFLPELKREGYEGIFSPKSRAKEGGDYLFDSFFSPSPL